MFDRKGLLPDFREMFCIAMAQLLAGIYEVLQQRFGAVRSDSSDFRLSTKLAALCTWASSSQQAIPAEMEKSVRWKGQASTCPHVKPSGPLVDQLTNKLRLIEIPIIERWTGRFLLEHLFLLRNTPSRDIWLMFAMKYHIYLIPITFAPFAWAQTGSIGISTMPPLPNDAQPFLSSL